MSSCKLILFCIQSIQVTPESELSFNAPIEALEGEIYPNFALAYDGHGLQFAGMGKEFLENHPEAKRYYDLAQEVLGYDILDKCMNGPKEDLNRTELAQPAIVAYNLAAYHALRQTLPEQMEIAPTVIAYQSLGLLNAMHRSGMFGDPESDEAINSVIKLSAIRRKLMQEASDSVDGGMWLLSSARKGGGLPSRRVKKIFNKASQVYAVNGVTPAIERNSAQTVISGLVSDFDKVNQKYGKKLKEDYGIVAIRLPGACGPFHSEYMQSAADGLREEISSWDLLDPAIPIQSNSSPVRDLEKKDEVIEELIEGITGVVKGPQMIDNIYEKGLSMFEVGEKMLIGDTMVFDERFHEGKKIPVKKIAAVGGGIAVVLGSAAAAYFIRRKRADDKGEVV